MSKTIKKIYSTYIHLSKYARWVKGEERRETWEETVSRYVHFFYEKYADVNEIPPEIWEELSEAIVSEKVMPSMRSLMTAGPALERCNSVGYNCAAAAVTTPRIFDEIFYLLMGGSGVGFSVERQYINQMPTVAEELYDSPTTIKVKDSRPGWAKAFKELVSLLYNGDIPRYDTSRVRSAGERLHTMGGRASGPEPLIKLFDYTIRLFKKAKGRRLNSLECHDLICTIADTVIVGSVRRSACISFSNLTDDRMRRAKGGQWWIDHPERALANNSIMFTEKPDLESYTKEFRSIYKSKSGERAIVNQEALQRKASATGRTVDFDGWFLLNPCGEAILRHSGGFCNLTEVVIRPEDTLTTLKEKVRAATILGTLQSTLTEFKYLRKVWTTNAEEERLLGVSLTGIMDHPVMSTVSVGLAHWLDVLKEVAVDTNREWAGKLDINPAKQITLVKPSGTVSQLVGCSSGIHPRYSEYYIRTVAQDVKDPLSDLMVDEGIPHRMVGDKLYFYFPMVSPEGSILQKDVDAIKQLDLWKMYLDHWCDGNPSQTIYYTDDTFLSVQDWVWKNWDSVGGLSFFPVADHIYDNAPYKEIGKEEYDKLVNEFPKEVDWTRLNQYESSDSTVTEVAVGCSGGQCEI